MTVKQGIIIGIIFLMVALAGSAGISYGVVELTATEGPPGPQGQPGEEGPRGLTGVRGADGSSDLNTSIALVRLANMWSLRTVIDEFNKTGFTSSSDPQVVACFDYVMKGEGSFVECGFER